MRGTKSNIGDKRVAPNGYHYTKTEEGWRLTHHLVMEKKLGRKIDSATERVVFLNGKRNDLRPDNLEIREKGKANLRRRRAQLEDRIRELQAELELVTAELDE